MAPQKEEGRIADAPDPGNGAASAANGNGEHTNEGELLRALTALLRGGSEKSADEKHSDKWHRRRLLLCIEDKQLRDKVRGKVDPKKYEVFSAELSSEASEILQEFRVEVIVLSPTFDSEHSGGAVLMQHVNRLTPQMRRRTYVILVSPQLRTMDTYLAFANGVNLSIHPEDSGSFQAILERSIRDFNELYRPLYQAMEIQAF